MRIVCFSFLRKIKWFHQQKHEMLYADAPCLQFSAAEQEGVYGGGMIQKKFTFSC